MGSVVMPKNSADIEVLIPVLEYYYKNPTWVENADYIEYIKKYLLDKGIDTKEREPQHYTKRMQILSYFSFIEWEDIENSQTPRKITKAGKNFYEAVRDDNQNKIVETIIESLENTTFGRRNFGAPSSESDIEAPCLCIRMILDLKFITKIEFAYMLYKLQDQGFTYSTVLQEIKDGRDRTIQYTLPDEANKYTDWKPINFLERFHVLSTEDSETFIEPDVLKQYENRLKNLKVYSIDKNIESPISSSLVKNFDKYISSKQKIIFGAPGTGKSHKLEEQQQKCFGDNFERVTFHPNYSYAQFVGTYKPVMKTNNNPLGDYEKKVIKILSDEKITPSEKYKMLYQSGINVSALCGLIGLTTGVTDFTTIKADGTISEKDHTLMSGVGKNMNPYATLKTLDKESEITYSYIPGPFMRVYVNAVKELKRAKAMQEEPKNFLLLIEEINRANVAAVFGDVFQLLDRKSDGTSQYPIAASEDQKNYLESCGINDDEISIPSNMYIWATMNSADQGVQPMDAAFKRRWDFEYIGIDDNEESVKDYVLPIPQKNSDGNIFYTSENWNKIRKDINNKLKNIYGVNEDKLLGPYFLSKSTLDEAKQINFESETDKAEKICSLFKSKILMYLYEDVVKMNPTELFSKSEFSEDKPIHYSDLCNKFDEIGLKIFGEEFVKNNG